MSRLLPLLALAGGLSLALAAPGWAQDRDPSPRAAPQGAAPQGEAPQAEAPPAQAEEEQPTALEDDLQMIPGRIAVLQALDKISARISTLKVPVGETVSWERLDIGVAKCALSSPFDRPERAALLRVRERRRDLGPAEVFSGWMFASSPGLHAMEHPVYDVVVIDCLVEDREVERTEKKPAPAARRPEGADTGIPADADIGDEELATPED